MTTTPASVSTLAVMIAVWLPRSRPLFTAAIGKLAESCPASITTDAGTVAAVVSLLVRTIVIGWTAGLAIETVPVVASAPAASLTVVWASVRPSVGTLSSTTSALSEPLWKPLAEAVIVAVSFAVDLAVVHHRDRERGRGRSRRDRHGRGDRQLIDVAAEKRNRQVRSVVGVLRSDRAVGCRIGVGFVYGITVQGHGQRGHVGVGDGERGAARDFARGAGRQGRRLGALDDVVVDRADRERRPTWRRPGS